MPASHRRHAEWSPERLKAWAAKIGPNTTILVEVILRDRSHPEQGFRSCLGIMLLSKSHDAAALEAACEQALLIGARSYTSVKSILRNNLHRHRPDPNSATNIGSLVPFFVMVFLAKGFVAATPLIVRGISGNLMVAAAPAIVSGSAGVLRGLVNTSGVQGRARIGALTTGEAIGWGAVQAPAAVRSAAATASAQVARMAERAKRLGQ